MAFQNGEGAIDLFEQDDAGEFVGERHFAEGEDGGGGVAGGVGETVSRANGEDEGLGIAILMVFEEAGEFLGGELLAAGVDEDQRVGGAHA